MQAQDIQVLRHSDVIYNKKKATKQFGTIKTFLAAQKTEIVRHLCENLRLWDALNH